MPLGTEVDLGAGHTVLDGDQVPSSPSFRSMSIAAKRSPISATAEHLLKRKSINHLAVFLSGDTIGLGGAPKQSLGDGWSVFD